MKSPKKTNISLRYTNVIKDYEKHIRALIYDYQLFQKVNISVQEFEKLLRTNKHGKMVNTNVTQKQWRLLTKQEKTDVKELATFVNILWLHRRYIKKWEANALKWQKQKDMLEKQLIAMRKQYNDRNEQYKLLGEKYAKEKEERIKKQLEKAKKNTVRALSRAISQAGRWKKLIEDTARQRLNLEIRALNQQIKETTSKMDKWDKDRFDSFLKKLIKEAKKSPPVPEKDFQDEKKRDKLNPLPQHTRYTFAYIGSLLAQAYDDAYDKAMDLYYRGLIRRDQIWETIRRFERENFLKLLKHLHQLHKIRKLRKQGAVGVKI